MIPASPLPPLAKFKIPASPLTSTPTSRVCAIPASPLPPLAELLTYHRSGCLFINWFQAVNYMYPTITIADYLVQWATTQLALPGIPNK